MTPVHPTSRIRRAAAIAVAMALFLFAACSGTKHDAANDPFEDPFFDDGFGTKWTNEVWHENAPSVGWLADPNREPRDAADGEPVGGEPFDAGSEVEALRQERSATTAGAGELLEDPGEPDRHGHETGKAPSAGHEERPFSEKAEEAAMSTLSILIGAGMTALPFLLGT
ncbi:MAG: hypothetical protein RL698_1692 [Pseudomonadota bacterium]|jgi:hypothetical protein